MTNLVDIVRYLIQNMDLTILVTSQTANRLYVCETKHVTVGKTVTDDQGNEYKVTAFEEDNWIEVTPDPLGTIITLTAPTVQYLHGTPASVNNEYLTISARQSKKTPFIWLLESYEEEEPGGDSAIEAIYRFRLFFMEGQVEEQSNDKHNENAIKPMRALSELFEAAILDDFSFKRPTDIVRKPRSRFGVEVTNRGSDRRIIDAALSGIEMELELEAYDTSTCTC